MDTQGNSQRGRVGGELLRLLSGVLGWIGCGVCVLYVLSRVVTDRVEWMQLVWWVPVAWWLIGIWGMWVLSWVLGRIAKRSLRARKVRGVAGQITAVRVMVVMAVLITAQIVVGVQRWHRGVLGGDGIDARDTDSLRFVHWNIGASGFDLELGISRLIAMDADVYLLSNSRWDGQRRGLIEGLTVEARGDGAEERTGGDTGYRAVTIGSVIVVSRMDVERVSLSYLEADPNSGGGRQSTGDRGWVCRVKFDEDDLVVWLVDLPSQPSAWRMGTIGRAVDAIESRRSGIQVYERVASGDDGEAVVRNRVRSMEDDGSLDRPGLVIGDFNTPRGSASIGLFDVFDAGSGFEDSFGERGYGRGRSWVPVRLKWSWVGSGLMLDLADWHIDLSLTGNGWRTTGYRLFEAAGGPEHRAQVVDIVR
ncbi:MAG: hypothetical protein AB8C13_06635 [Phycisphaerales bacterium]